jgi:hypothetical protein
VKAVCVEAVYKCDGRCYIEKSSSVRKLISTNSTKKKRDEEIHHFFSLFCHFAPHGLKAIFYYCIENKKMTDLNNKRANLIRIEFWAITTIFVFGLFFFLVDGFTDDDRAGNTPYEGFFNNAGVPFDYYNNYFTPVLLELLFQAGAFLALNFYIVPGLVRKEALIKNIALLILVFICLGLIDGITDTYIHAYLYAGNTSTGTYFKKFFTPVRSFLLFGIYTLLKYTGLYLITNSGNIEKKYRFVQRDGINAFVIWLISMFLLIVFEAEKELVLAWE